MRRTLPLAALALAAAPAAAHASVRVVDMPGKFFTPPSLAVLSGDTVTWTNDDAVDHDVAQLGSAFDSGHIAPGGRYSFTFSQPGHYAYRCTIHAFMAGSVDVYAFQLRGPDGPTSIGRPAVLRGLAPAGTRLIRIEARRPDGTWAPVTAVVPRPDGAFSVRVTPAAPTVYRAIADAGPSGPLALKVGARLDTSVRRVHGGRYAISATARPAQPGAPAALQLYSRERFRWRQVAHATVGHDSRVSFTVSPPGHYAARVVLLRGKGGYGASVGPTQHLGGHAKRHTPRMPHMPHMHMRMG